MKERDLIRRIVMETRMPEAVPVGPGDDLAVIAPPPGQLVFGVDTIVEGIDFYPPDSPNAPDPVLIGRKACLVNLSDIAAMGADPFCMVVSAAFKKGLPNGYVESIYEGIKAVEAEYGLALAGGDISAIHGPTVLTVAVIGTLPGKPLLRSGAKPGDALLVTGNLGGSILGRHLDFPPRLAEGRFLVQAGATSCIDISDGLATDARHIAESSNVCIEINADSVPISQDARALSRKDKKSPFQHALTDGEDFELLFTTSQNDAQTILDTWPFDTPITVIGKVMETGADADKGQVYLMSGKGRSVLVDGGYEHEI